MAVARLYAEATHGLAVVEDCEDAVLDELSVVVDLLDRQPEVEQMFASPLVDTEERSSILERVFRHRLSDLLVDSFQVMNRKHRLGLLRAFAKAYGRVFEESKGIVEVRVTTAIPLGEKQRLRAAESASRLVRGKARLVEAVDPSLLGGMVLQVGDTKFDTSVSRELATIGQRLYECSSRELLSGKSHVSNGGGGGAASSNEVER
jgi:F-type H+-transporting ATPase subunit delta